MSDESKVPEVPVVETPETAVEESPIDLRRAELEKLVIAENETFPEEAPAVPVEVKEDAPKLEIPSETDPVEHIKKAVQKRIDKLTAKQKSAEEKLVEAQAEIERLKASPKPSEPPSEDKKDDALPTISQVKAYIKKMREEGNIDEEVSAMEYLVELKKTQAIEEVEGKQKKIQEEEQAKVAKTNAELRDLALDYVAYDAEGNPDPSSDLNISNQKGLLFKTAMALFNDKELHAERYNNSNVVQGFRTAVSDAFIAIHQKGLVKPTPKGEQIIQEKRSTRQVLAEPSTEGGEEISPRNSDSLSDAEKVREEIKSRNKNRYVRRIPQ